MRLSPPRAITCGTHPSTERCMKLPVPDTAWLSQLLGRQVTDMQVEQKLPRFAIQSVHRSLSSK